MKQALFSLVVGMFIAGVIYLASNTFLPEPFRRIGIFVANVVGVIVVIAFIAYLLGVSSPIAI